MARQRARAARTPEELGCSSSDRALLALTTDAKCSKERCAGHVDQPARAEREMPDGAWCARRDLNPRPTGSKPAALSS